MEVPFRPDLARNSGFPHAAVLFEVGPAAGRGTYMVSKILLTDLDGYEETDQR